MSSLEVYLLAFGANLTFSSASMVFSIYARRFSPMWINQVKVFFAFVAFLLALIVSQNMVALSASAWGLLALSGFIGLCLGDILLFRAYATLGAGRSLVIFSTQPLLLGLYAYLFLGQVFTLNQTLAVICMIICIFIFMLERNQLTGSWDLKSFLWAFSGIALDAIGVMMTRSAYEMTPGLETFQVNVVRCLAALVGFLLLDVRSFSKVTKDLVALSRRDLVVIISASIFGCFVALTLYLAALKHAHIGTLTAISITGPIWVSLLECLYYRKPPSWLQLAALAFFLTGFYLMLIA